ncbi:hypothetical protein WICMUC_002752 [Wickerhamomyces mucosus]|uniref:Pre-mRNA-splicing factor SLU7 n=1 Tax=Wickerhamomyces mucosus TaxID=1378264 RepID=A0A9P8PNE7_9ASCO|nr:hypothetical protein WICMUC_002752 [Wickerhamomyces mucosus]
MPKENRHIPKYIKDAPWYKDTPDGVDPSDYLAHHRNIDSDLTANNQPRIGLGIRDDFVTETSYQEIPKFRSRIVKRDEFSDVGAKHFKKNGIQKKLTEESVPTKGKRNENVDYDGKRDRWYGYDSKTYNATLQKWEETHRTELEVKRLDESEIIELKELGLWELYQANPHTFFQKSSKTVRLLEDKAIYLKDISKHDSITYDPKSRTDRDDSVGYFNDRNLFVRHLTGDAKRYEESKRFAWDDKARGVKGDINISSNPTLAGMKMEEQSKEQQEKRRVLKNNLLNRYNTNAEIDGDETEDNESNKVVRSQFNEDVFLGNHTSVWGSYYQDGKWGFLCCKKFDRNSLCK